MKRILHVTLLSLLLIGSAAVLGCGSSEPSGPKQTALPKEKPSTPPPPPGLPPPPK